MKRIGWLVLIAVCLIGVAALAVIGKRSKTQASATPVMLYSADAVRVTVKGYVPHAQPVPYGTDVRDVLFDGYPQIVKQDASKPIYGIKVQKDVRVPMRDGVRLAADVYRPNVDGEKFPAILTWGHWGKDVQEAVAWNWDKPQPYYDSPFWDGTMEGGNYTFTVPRGYVHVIPDWRGIGNSEGYGKPGPAGEPGDIYDTIEWIAGQPWSNGKVGMMGPSSYSSSQIRVAPLKPPHLVALHVDEGGTGIGEQFHGMFDTLAYHIRVGRHGNDAGAGPLADYPPNYEYTPAPPRAFSLPKEELDHRVREALEDPDIRYNSKWYSFLRYPRKDPSFFDSLLSYYHPRPGPQTNIEKITIPTMIGTPWVTRLYLWGCFEAWEHLGTPKENKRMMLYPPGFPPRPYASYHDETVRWYDYWLKGIDTGVKDEPPIKLFVMGINKWKFENEWPLQRTAWKDFYLQPGGGLSTAKVNGTPEPDSFTQPAPYLDPKVYSLRYSTGPLKTNVEVTGPIALYLQAAIDQDDTNWIVDLVDVDQQGNRQWISVGYLKAKFRAVDEVRSKPYRPVHLRQDPVPVPPGKVVEYAISMMPTSCVFQAGHSMELIVRNQDDVLSRLGAWGVYMLPFMRTVTHKIYFGKSHLVLPIIPAREGEAL